MLIGKKKLMIIFSIILTIIMISQVFGVEITTYKPKYGITTEKVNLRFQSDSTKSNVLETLAKSLPLKIIGEQNNFYIVQTEKNKVGFVSKDYIKLTDTQTKGLSFESLTPQKYKTTNNANVRIGPSSSFKKISLLKTGTTVTVFGKIDGFYTVIFDNNKVGLISSSLLTESYENVDENPDNLSKSDLVIYYINEARKSAGLPILKDNSDLKRIANIKAEDMVKNNYFLHTSKTYGTPFNMMKNSGITYISAGENLAGNTSMKSAVDKWLASDSHSKNILSTKFNYVGVGVVESKKYGYIIVAMFIEK